MRSYYYDIKMGWMNDHYYFIIDLTFSGCKFLYFLAAFSIPFLSHPYSFSQIFLLLRSPSCIYAS